jgi:HlyD family secretion protein
VAEIRNAPTTIQNVVTYDVVVKVANPELKLKPGMTANVSIITALEKSVLKVPNAALRFKWPSASTAPDRGSTGAAGTGRPQAVRATNGAKTQGVWILDGQKPRRAPLTLGISDGNETAVLSGELKEGDAVIIESTGQAKKGASQSGGPRFF